VGVVGSGVTSPLEHPEYIKIAADAAITAIILELKIPFLRNIVHSLDGQTH